MPFYRWRAARWVRSSIRPLQWKLRQRKSVNTWSSSVQDNILYQYVSLAVASKISESMIGNLQCHFSGVQSMLKTVACECGVNLGPECAVAVKEDAVLSQTQASCGQSKTISAGGLQVKLNSDSIQQCNSTTNIDVGLRTADPTSGFPAGSHLNHIPTKARLAGAATSSAACFAQVKNNNNVIVGQLRGDCVVFSASGSVSNVRICMTQKTSIPYDSSSYPVSGVALSSKDSTNTLVYLATNLAVIVSGTQWCTTVSTSGAYCPVSLMNNYATVPSSSPATCGVSASILSVAQATITLQASATKLAFVAQPQSGTLAGNSISPAITVEFQDGTGARVTGAEASVTISLKSGTGTAGALVTGTARVSAVTGLATFSTLSVDKSGIGYQLVASSGRLTAATSTAFDVSAGAPVALQFVQQPAGAVTGLSFLTQPKVAVVDSQGNVVTTSTASITVAAQQGGSSVSVTGTSTVQAVNGVATFTNLALATIQTSYTLTASSTGLSGATSATFDVVSASGSPVKLAIQTHPAGAQAGVAFGTQPVVVIQDANSAIVASASNLITLTIKAGSGTAAATISNAIIQAVSGVAAFSTTTIDKAGTGYVITATATGLVSADTTAFTVNGPKEIVFTTQPVGGRKDEPLTTFPTVEIRDVTDRVITSSSDYVTLSIKTNTGSSGASLVGTIRRQATAGVVQFTGISLPMVGTNYVLVATADSGVLGESDAFTISEIPAPTSSAHGGTFSMGLWSYLLAALLCSLLFL